MLHQVVNLLLWGVFCVLNHRIAKNSSSSLTKMLVRRRQMTRIELLVRGLSCQV